MRSCSGLCQYDCIVIRGSSPGSRGDAIAEEADGKNGKLMMGCVRESLIYGYCIYWRV